MATNSERKSIALFVAGMKKPKASKPMENESYDDEEPMDDSNEGLEAAAEELVRAIKRGDIKGVVDAFCSMQDQHSSSDKGDEDDSWE